MDQRRRLLSSPTLRQLCSDDAEGQLLVIDEAAVVWRIEVKLALKDDSVFGVVFFKHAGQVRTECSPVE